ncbi:RagB/SusD family nutrient uptake outer membrane protein [Arachidicoccus ginsenosidivorans]|uniref:RagB/SusD family nutrient uptake outer membrane protein n=1 Tax=Arachidicoccus ginsenosidivorans TaxID=496057 RepID=A0A5B8VT20_9BACT|nr:RagB/SusD family nutrient uptake outer membrane protein [Arachidicoccus ginsenosidivorans]QEC74062.1 RagB/SusD family nutrient uptake outer membrane protein [Arachidicoccus ginsenosidivorans]
MKQLFFASMAILLMGAMGCNKFLNEQPQTEIGETEFWRSEADIQSGMAAIYDGFQDCFGNDYVLWGDARTDEVWRNQYGVDDHVLNALSATSSGTSWANFYEVINRANVAIKNIPLVKAKYVPGMDQAVLNHYLSQAYGARAFAYYWIVRLWGAAPLWTAPYENINEDPDRPRTEAAVILDTVYADLQKAVALSDPKSGNVFEITTGALYAMLMDVSMWKKDYGSALQSFDKLMALNKYSIEPTATWKNLFIDPRSTKGAIWSLDWDWTVDGGASISALIGAGDTNSDFAVEDSVWNYFTQHPMDIRGAQTIDFDVTNHDKFNKFYPKSVGKQVYPNHKEANVLFPLYRLADLFLLRAEIANQQNDPATALQYLNIIHERAGLTAYFATDFPSKATMENAILEERKLELYMEAKRWFDLVRTGKVVEVMDPVLKARQALRMSPEIGFGDKRKILWPINRNVLNANIKLEQNPPY